MDEVMKKVERVWIDYETTGLKATEQAPLEFGIHLTNIWGGSIAEASWLIWDDECYEDFKREADPYVRDMHVKSGLWEELESEAATFLPKEVENLALDFLDKHEVPHGKLPMCGNNVPFDRAFAAEWMPKLEAHFHYRNVDISSVKELCRGLNPRVFEAAPVKNEQHRVLPDLMETIGEYRHYVDNFFWVEV